jgi:hypothetical protein
MHEGEVNQQSSLSKLPSKVTDRKAAILAAVQGGCAANYLLQSNPQNVKITS